MNNKLLVVDIGNTHITLGIFQGNKITAHWRISSVTTRTIDESWIMVKMLCQSENVDIKRITGCAISSVVPDQTFVFSAMVENELNVPVVVVDSNLDTGIEILYHDPTSVGADRICNAVAGYEKFGGPLIIVDFGTATTFDIVSGHAEYLGGIIAPGVETSSLVLHKFAARLPKVELKFPEKIIGTTTESSMQAGIMYGTVELVNGLIQRISKELGNENEIIATGGIAKIMSPKLAVTPKFEPHLTLEGLQIIFNRTCNLK
ncbi:MAG: type III pantothenate kinase [bacterium]